MKKIYLLLCCGLVPLCARAQEMMLGMGPVLGGQSTYSYNAAFSGFTFITRGRFHIDEHQSFSLGIPVMIGSTDDDYILQTALIFDLNRGAGSSKHNTDRFGYFLGAGLGIQAVSNLSFYKNYPFDGDDVQSMHGAGPMVNAGIRMRLGKRGTNLELKLSALKTLDRSQTSAFQLSFVCNFSIRKRGAIHRRHRRPFE